MCMLSLGRLQFFLQPIASSRVYIILGPRLISGYSAVGVLFWRHHRACVPWVLPVSGYLKQVLAS